jgi:hypothetical protein
MRSFQLKRTQRKYKSRYGITNWAEYEAGLRQRGSVTIWITADAKDPWCHRRRRKPGGKRVYSDTAIETAYALGMIYGLGLRQTEGFIGSLFELESVSLPVPDHTVVSRRVRKLGKVAMIPRRTKGPIHLLVDSSGLKIHVGTARKPPKPRVWRKIHLGVDRATGDIVAADLTASSARDAARVPALLNQIENELASISAAGAYDKESVYDAVEAHSPDRRTRVLIPPQRGAQLSPDTQTPMRERNRNIRSIDRVGRREWHLHSGYTKRSRVENVFYRYKAILGREMKARTLAGQRVEARIGCRILNTMARLGMPQSSRAA